MNRPARKPIANGNLAYPSADANVGMNYVTALLYQHRRLLSTEFSFKSEERYPFLSSSVAVSGPDLDSLECSPLSGSAFFDVRRVLASCAGPSGYSPFGHSVCALTCEFLRHSCRWGRSQGFLARLWSAILPPAPCALSAPAWWRLAAWPLAGCLVGSRLSPCGDVTGRREWL